MQTVVLSVVLANLSAFCLCYAIRQRKAAMTTKTVFLIRHAESAENQRMKCLSKSLHDLGSFSVPSREDVKSSLELFNVKAQIDSDVSELGNAQIKQLGERLRRDDFVKKMGIQVVAHSPLKRARQTSEGMLGCVTCSPENKEVDSSWAGTKAKSVGRVVELQCLSERTVFEWIPIQHDAFMDRIKEFEEWLGNQPEERIAIVGHSQYFKSMLGLSYKFENCDVWEINFDPSGEEPDVVVEVDVNTNEAVKVIKDNQVSGIEAVKSSSDDTTEFISLPRGWSGLKRLYSYISSIDNR